VPGPSHTVVPADHVRRLKLEQVTDALDCMWRYRRRWVDKITDLLPEPVVLQRMVWQVVKDMVKAKASTGARLLHEDFDQAALEALGEVRKAPSQDQVDMISRAAWCWYEHHGHAAQVMMMDAPYQLELDSGWDQGGKWSLTGQVPMVFRTTDAPYAQVAVLLVGHSSLSDHQVQTDPRVVHAWMGATHGLKLKVGSVTVLQVVLGPEPGSDQLLVAAPKVGEEQARVALLQAQGARLTILDHFASRSWHPNRRAATCSFSACRTAGPCEENIGGLVAP